MDPRASACSLHRLTSGEVRDAIEVLARAFDRDPFIDWLVRSDAGRSEAVRRWFRVCLRNFTMPLNEVWATGGLEGVALWTPPGRLHVGPAEQARLLWQAARGHCDGIPGTPRLPRTSSECRGRTRPRCSPRHMAQWISSFPTFDLVLLRV
jgi:hypothetical protein